MRFFKLNSGIIFLAFLASCAASPYKNFAPATANPEVIKTFQPDFGSVLYRTQVDVMGNHLSGLLLFKKMDDGSTRTVFTNEMGLTFFDFEFSDQGFSVKKVMEKLDKKPVINQLRKDIGFILMQNLDYNKTKVIQNGEEKYFGFKSGKETTYYVTNQDETKLLRIENASKRKKKVEVSLSDYKNGLPDSAFFDHKLFNFTIALKQIDR